MLRQHNETELLGRTRVEDITDPCHPCFANPWVKVGVWRGREVEGGRGPNVDAGGEGARTGRAHGLFHLPIQALSPMFSRVLG